MSTITAASSREQRVTARSLQLRKGKGEPFSMLTAYDAPFARIFDEAGIDVLLVGDSVGNTVQGGDTTLPVTLDEMKSMPALKDMVLLKRGRLSVQPVTAAEWAAIVERGRGK